MSPATRYPAEPVGSFQAPPQSFVDAAGREIALREFGDGPRSPDAERDALLAMYAAFDPADRAQGVPPVHEPSLVDWVDRLLRDDCVNVLAWDGETVVGHAVLVPDDGDGSSELAIFVLQDHQRAGIGTRLIRALLGAGEAAGVERVWLTVERWNHPAITLYEAVGFETTHAASFELELALRLA